MKPQPYKNLRQLLDGQRPQKVLIFFESSDQEAAIKAGYLIEEGHTYKLDNKWSVRSDPPHHAKMQQHYHLLCRGKDVCVINRDGSQSHNTNTNAVPNWIMRELKNRKLFEGGNYQDIVPSAARKSILVPRRIIVDAERRLKEIRYRMLLARIRELIAKRSKPPTRASRLMSLLKELEK